MPYENLLNHGAFLSAHVFEPAIVLLKSVKVAILDWVYDRRHLDD